MISTVILIKETAMDNSPLNTHYILPLSKEGIPSEEVDTRPLLYNKPSRIDAKVAKAYLDKLITKIPDTVTKLIIADSTYYKTICKMPKVSANYGNVIKGAYPGYEKFDCVYVPNHKSLFKQPDNKKLIDIGIKAIAGTNNSVLIKSAEYGFTFGSDRELLDSLYKYPVLSADIETSGLDLRSSVVSITFCWSKNNGIAIDLGVTGLYYLKKFLENYKGKLVFHGGLFDAKLLIRNLWMRHDTDYEGMLEGLQYFRDFDDTMILAYLATNSTTKVGLGLKELALEYVGHYAIEIDDITKYTKKEILQYNLIDGLGTFYLYEKYQAELTSKPYLEIFQPSLYTLLKMMLVGLPMDSEEVRTAGEVLTAREKILHQQIQENDHIKQFNILIRTEACEEAKKIRTEKLLAGVKVRTPVKTVEDFQDLIFNPNSGPQKAKLIKMLKLPILDTTKTGAPSTGREILENLQKHTTDQEIIDLLQFMVELAEVAKINGTFIKALLQEENFLHGSLKLGGTQSGRLSSSDPNLTNMPSHGPMGKLIKKCIKAPPGWLFCGADFDALEEKIGAILSGDPHRIKVYTDGFDGHAMRTVKYFGDQMPDIQEALQKAETSTEFWVDDNGNYCCS